jgi:TRAP-type C4-dicarboxylate transport system permease large subunit
VYPSLRENGYNERFTVGLIASSGAIAVVIPPSIAMILYSLSAQQSAVALFTAGILPSLLIGFVDALFVIGYARIKAVPLTAGVRWAAVWESTKEASWSIGTVAVIFGGIYGGIFTPTEAAGVSPIHFGIIMAVNLSIGMYTPPFGLNLFASQAVFETPLGKIYVGVLPFLLINFATLMIITYVPSISMVLLGR